MTFEQLLAKAAEEANSNELVTMTATQARGFLDGNEIPDFDNAIDHAQGDVFTGEKAVAYILIKVQGR